MTLKAMSSIPLRSPCRGGGGAQRRTRSTAKHRRYAESMSSAIGAALLLMPQRIPEAQPEGGRRALILCAAEHGFVGGFNARLIEAAESVLKAQDALFVLGSRGAALAFERGRQASWTRPMATRLAGAPDTVNRLTSELYAYIGGGQISRIEVIFGRYRQSSPPTIERHLLLPLDVASFSAAQPQQAPLHNLAPHVLLEKLMEAAVESMASENAARFAAMESAHDNVSKRLDQLRQDARQARQSEITAELLDLITGTEALTVTSLKEATRKVSTS
jgi:F-type H+-transporting ATPase subunit gamma